MKIAIAVHGRFHGFELAGELHRRHLLAGLLTTYPRFAVRRFLPPDVPISCAPWLELLRRLHGRWPVGPSPDVFIGAAFARFTATHLPKADVLVGWSGATLEAMAPAQARGMRVVIERGSSHIAHQAQVLAEEYARFGLAFQPVDARMIAREEAEYAQAHAIAVPTGFARDTFLARGIPAERLMVNPYGVDLSRFAPPTQRPDGKIRVLFVGRVGLRKGVPNLIHAFRRLAGSAELHLVGPVEAGMEPILSKAGPGVVVRGPLPGGALAAEYGAAHVFCLPSLEEGLPLTLLQAMACGLPVVASPQTGAADVIDPGQEGLIVPSGDPDALAEALASLIADPDARHAMGAAARARVAHGHGWGDYAERAVAAYGRLLGS
ncbi:MAG: glycosyltransferase family 4 protein [Rhodospirillaceae bacterium]|nr:glycosyltransferase family 4 protein [Rhodospirillales bacterium]